MRSYDRSKRTKLPHEANPDHLSPAAAGELAFEAARALHSEVMDCAPCHEPQASGTPGPERWLIDTGCGYDLVGRKDVAPWFQRHATRLPRPIVLTTANGPATVAQSIELQVGPLGAHVKPLLLDRTPPALSVGRRCMEEGYSFYWPAGQTPYLVTPQGKRVVLEVIGNIPYLNDPFPACPAAPGASSSSGAAGPPLPPPVAPPREVADEAEVEMLDSEPEGDGEPGGDDDNDPTSIEHLMTHRYKRPRCECQEAKLHARPGRRRPPRSGLRRLATWSLLTMP